MHSWWKTTNHVQVQLMSELNRVDMNWNRSGQLGRPSPWSGLKKEADPVNNLFFFFFKNNAVLISILRLNKLTQRLRVKYNNLGSTLINRARNYVRGFCCVGKGWSWTKPVLPEGFSLVLCYVNRAAIS